MKNSSTIITTVLSILFIAFLILFNIKNADDNPVKIQLSGSVINEYNNNPIPGLSVIIYPIKNEVSWLSSDAIKMVTDRNGAFNTTISNDFDYVLMFPEYKKFIMGGDPVKALLEDSIALLEDPYIPRNIIENMNRIERITPLGSSYYIQNDFIDTIITSKLKENETEIFQFSHPILPPEPVLLIDGLVFDNTLTTISKDQLLKLEILSRYKYNYGLETKVLSYSMSFPNQDGSYKTFNYKKGADRKNEINGFKSGDKIIFDRFELTGLYHESEPLTGLYHIKEGEILSRVTGGARSFTAYNSFVITIE